MRLEEYKQKRDFQKTPAPAGPDKRSIEIKGRKLRGRYALIMLKPNNREERNRLFFKLKGPL